MLPEGWKKTRVGNEYTIQLGKMLNKLAKEKYPQFSYLTNINVRWGKIVVDELNTMYFSEDEREKFSLLFGDLLVCEGGDVGRCAIWEDNLENCFYQKALHRIRSLYGNKTVYLKYILEYFSLTGRFKDIATKTSIAHLTKEQLENTSIELPPLPEQEKIAAILSTWDKAISTTDALLENSRQQKKALMQQLLTGKRRLPGFKGEWKGYALGSLLREIKRPVTWDDNSFYKLLSVKRRSEGVILREILQGKNILTKKMNEVYAGDFLISKMQVVHGAMGIVPDKFHKFHISDSYIALIPKNDKLLYMPFFDYFSRQQKMYHMALISSYGVHIEKMTFNISLFLKKQITIPVDIHEQRAIAAVLDAADREITLLEQKAAGLREEKKALMQQLLTGKRRVRV